MQSLTKFPYYHRGFWRRNSEALTQNARVVGCTTAVPEQMTIPNLLFETFCLHLTFHFKHLEETEWEK